MKRPPQFWAAHEESTADPRGRKFRVKVWGWSDESHADDAVTAGGRAQELMARGGPGSAPADWYCPAAPLREPVLETIDGGATASASGLPLA